jgi:hypothetical protein
MRTLMQIIDAAKDGQKPSYDECYWAMLALCSLWNLDRGALFDLADQPHPLRTVESIAERSFNRGKRALATSPQEWLGPDSDPANPDYQYERGVFAKLLEKAIAAVEEDK